MLTLAEVSELRERADLIRRILDGQRRLDLKRLTRDNPWLKLARPNQLPPPGDWSVWLILSGRGFGKTRGGSEWIVDEALNDPGTVRGVVGATWRDTQDVPIRAVLDVLRRRNIGYRLHKSDLHLTLANGSEIIGYSADKPDRIRGANLSGAWCDELAHFQYAATLWDEALVPAVRIGERPRILVTTTPRPIMLIKELLGRDDGSVAVVRGSTFDNAANLSSAVLAELRRRYEGTRIGRQELYGEVLDDAENALWNQDLLEAVRWDKPIPKLARLVVSVDPSGSADGDATGIVTVGIAADNVLYVLADDTIKGSPETRYEQACRAARRHAANVIVYEAAYGGDNIAHGLRAAWKATGGELMPALVASPTKKSKEDRAHPVVALYEQTANGFPRIYHPRPVPELEEEMVQWEPGIGWSPNRIDALVHGVRYLVGPGFDFAELTTMAGLPDLPAISL